MPDTDEVALARRMKFAKTWNINPLVAEIVEILLVYGGSAHRNLVAERIAMRRTQERISDGLRREIFEAFDAHREGAARTGQPSLVFLPFGGGSHRWALTPDAQSVLERSPLSLARPASSR
ncbi:MAG: hypothetical protein V4597_12025 [Pseudomonadota bacterium]